MTKPQADSSDGQPLHATAVITGVPGSGDRLEQVLVRLAGATRSEDGCLLYSLQRVVENPDQFVTVEKWTGKDALDAHLASEHLRSALADAQDSLAGAPMIMSTRLVPAENEAKSTY